MTIESQRDIFERLVRAAIPGAHLVHLWPMEGGVSATVTAMEIAEPDGVLRKMIVREHGVVDRETNPNIARDEFRVLKVLADREMPVPSPVFLDEHATFFDHPCLIVDYVDGNPNFEPEDVPGFVMQMAGHLSLVHKLNCADHDLNFLPSAVDRGTQLVATTGGAGSVEISDAILAGLKHSWPPVQHNSDVLLHHDFWPGNLICEGERIVGVIDWEDAATGDPLADLANSRIEVLWAFGQEAMEQFTGHYQRNSNPDVQALPYWDLNAALRHASAFSTWAVDHPNVERMRIDHKYFVEQATKKLP